MTKLFRFLKPYKLSITVILILVFFQSLFDLDDAGKVFLIDFWATWCAPCRETTSVMTSLHNMYSDQGLVVLGIAVNDNESNVRKYVSEHGIVYPVIARQSRDDTPLIKIIQDYGVQAIPTLVLIDKSGVVRHVSIGVSPDRAKFQEGLGNLIVGLLKEGQ